MPAAQTCFMVRWGSAAAMALQTPCDSTCQDVYMFARLVHTPKHQQTRLPCERRTLLAVVVLKSQSKLSVGRFFDCAYSTAAARMVSFSEVENRPVLTSVRRWSRRQGRRGSVWHDCMKAVRTPNNTSASASKAHQVRRRMRPPLEPRALALRRAVPQTRRCAPAQPQRHGASRPAPRTPAPAP